MAAAPAAARWHLPTRRLRSLIPPRKQSPAADGRLQARTNASVRLTFFGRRHRAPPSLDACCYFSRGGTLRARPAEAAAPRAPGAPAASSPCPAATCPRAQGKAGAAGAPLPQTRSGRSFPLLPPSLLLFYFFNSFRNPLWGRGIGEEPAAGFKSGRKRRRNRCAPYRSAVPLPARPLLLPLLRPATSAAAGGGGRTDRAAAGRPGRWREGGRAGWLALLPSLSLRLSEAAACCEATAPRRCRAAPGLQAAGRGGSTDPPPRAAPAAIIAPHGPQLSAASLGGGGGGARADRRRWDTAVCRRRRRAPRRERRPRETGAGGAGPPRRRGGGGHPAGGVNTTTLVRERSC